MNTSYNNLTKVELHVHLDCCLSYNALKRINPEISFDLFNNNLLAHLVVA